MRSWLRWRVLQVRNLFFGVPAWCKRIARNDRVEQVVLDAALGTSVRYVPGAWWRLRTSMVRR